MPVTINGTTGIAGVDGSAGTPSVQGTDTNTGMFFPAADTIAFAEGGVEALRINSDSQVVTVAGTASLPAITTTGDTNTGIFFPAADTIALVTAGTEDFRIGSAGQFGIQGANYGSSGQVLTSQGSGSAPVWASPAGGGVTSLAAGNGITVSASTGAVTVSQDIYSGTSATNTSFPIATVILVNANSIPTNLASSITIYVPNTAGAEFFVQAGGGRVALTGTWRARGYAGSADAQPNLFQRTA